MAELQIQVSEPSAQSVKFTAADEKESLVLKTHPIRFPARKENG